MKEDWPIVVAALLFSMAVATLVVGHWMGKW